MPNPRTPLVSYSTPTTLVPSYPDSSDPKSMHTLFPRPSATLAVVATVAAAVAAVAAVVAVVVAVVAVAVVAVVVAVAVRTPVVVARKTVDVVEGVAVAGEGGGADDVVVVVVVADNAAVEAAVG